MENDSTTSALGFVKNNPWVKVDRERRMREEQEQKKQQLLLFQRQQQQQQQSSFILQPSFLLSNQDQSINNNQSILQIRSTTVDDEEVEYGPGFVQKQRQRYLQRVAGVSPSSDTFYVEETSKRRKYKAYGRRTASCDDLMSDDPQPPRPLPPPRRKEVLHVKSRSSSNVLVDTQQSSSVRPVVQLLPPVQLAPVAPVDYADSLPPPPPPQLLQPARVDVVDPPLLNQDQRFTAGEATKKVGVEDSAVDVVVAPVSLFPSLKNIYDDSAPFHNQSSSSSLDVQAKKSRSEEFLNESAEREEVPEFVKMAKRLKHVNTPIVDSLPSSLDSPQIPIYSSEQSTSTTKSNETFDENISKRNVNEKTSNSIFVDKDEIDAPRSTTTEKNLIDTRRTKFGDSLENIKNVPEAPEIKNSSSKNESVVNEPPPPRILSPVPDLSEMTKIIDRLNQQRKLRESQAATAEADNRKVQLVQLQPDHLDSTEKSAKTTNIYDGVERNNGFSSPAPTIETEKPRISLTRKFMEQNKEKDSPTVDDQQNGNHLDSTSNGIGKVQLNRTNGHTDDYKPFSDQNGFHTIAVYNPPASPIVNNFSGEDDDDLLLDEEDKDENTNIQFEVIGGYVKVENSSIKVKDNALQKKNSVVEFRSDSPLAYVYVEEIDAESLGSWEEGKKLNYGEYKELANQMRKEKMRNGEGGQDEEELDSRFGSGNLSQYQPSALKSVNFNLGSTMSELDSESNGGGGGGTEESDSRKQNGEPSAEGVLVELDNCSSPLNENGTWSSENNVDLLF